LIYGFFQSFGTSTSYDSQVCAAHVAPRALPKGCDFGKEILQVWLGGYAQQGSLQALESKNDERKRMLSMDVGNN